jgi:hypothetical protein
MHIRNLKPPYSTKTKILIASAIVTLLIVNFYVLASAYPETFRLDGAGTLAKDFSAYYIGAWRLWHDPSHLYTYGIVNDGEVVISPQPQLYKYLPSFLLLISPFQFLNYHEALIAFDIFQFALLPLIGLLLYKLLYRKGATAILIVAAIVLLPFPLPHWGPIATYFWQWAEGQAKVFETFLFLLSFYLGSKGKPYGSGAVFAFAAFDPRFGLLGLPLFLIYNKNSVTSALKTGFGCAILTNFILFYPPTATGFLSMVFGHGISTTLYAYTYIPLLTLLSLILANGKEIISMLSVMGQRLKGKSKIAS